MEEVPLLKQLAAKYSKSAAIIGISIDVSVPRVDRTIKEKGMTYPILADGKGFEGPIPTAYHIQGTPDLFVLDGDGRIVKRLGSAKELDATLQSLLDQSKGKSDGRLRAAPAGHGVNSATPTAW
jgi:peroxiredoxin